MFTLSLPRLRPSLSARLLSKISRSLIATFGASLLLTGCGGGGSNTGSAALPTAIAPVFSPAGGSFTATQTVSMTDATTGASIYYTLDGSTPTAASSKYASPITVATTTTISAIAVASSYNNSPVAAATYTITAPPAAAPVFTPAAGTYTSAQTVSLSDTTSGASIYYTLDGSTPSASSTKYAAPLTIGSTTTVNAIAIAAGFSNSPVASAVYTINLPAAAAPTFSPAAGTYSSVQTVALADASPGAVIYYTLDGSAPTTGSARYTAPLSVNTTTTINAIATSSGYTTSPVSSGVFTINLPPTATPTFSPAAGTFTSAQAVSLADATSGAVIYYTLDGSTPTTASAKYVAPLSVSTTTTIKALALATNYVTSAIATGTFTINLPAAATPVFSPSPGTYTSAQTVSISDSSAGATIYYTLDGSTPTIASARYAGPISVSSTQTINAIATASGFNQSAVASGTFTINLPAAATPTFSVTPGTFTSAQTVALSDATAGAVVYYTLDGSTPTVNSTRYSGPISVSSTETISAIATATGYNQSAVASGTFTINLPAAATPTFSPVAGTFTSAQTVTIADATAGSVIYYTTDGSTPTTASNVYSTPIAVGTTETLNAIATASGYKQSAVGTAAYTINLPNQSVSVTLSTYDSVSLLAPQASVTFGNAAASSNQLLIDETQTYQSVEGFGASFTDSAGYLLEQVAQPSQLAGTLSDLFTRTGNGIGLSFMRSPMGASDIARTAYSYDDTSSADPSLNSFTVSHDQTSIIPLILAAKNLNPQMKLMGSPWSPPGWMKSTTSLEGGTLNSTYYTAYANYFIKYLKAYQTAGVLPDYISLQNEPLNNVTTYPTMGMDAPTQLTLVRDYVLPALATSGLSTKILLYDHNWDTPSYPASILTDPTILASPLVAGTAWHGYGGPPGAQQGVQNSFPTKGQWETEHSGGTFVGNQFISDFNEITLVLRNAGKSYVKWSLALDQNRGPNLSQLGGSYGGCNTCSGIVTVNNSTGAITKTIEYYTLGQYSKFILPGAVRVWSSDTPTVVSSAFINPDGTRVLVAFNNAFASATFQVQWGSTQNFSYTLPAYGVATFVWSGTQTGTPTQSATQQIQGASYSSQLGLEVEETTDDTGSYDLGYVTDGATMTYKNVNFGTSVSQVNVRVASGGSGGTVEFHLDSPTGTPIATAKLVVTGGYQTWQTVTAPVSSGVSGVHTLYMVIHGSGGIGNVNWFQFQ